MSFFRGVFSSSVGTKLLVGLTGLFLLAYLLLHLAGNLLVFAGQEAFNGYAHMLISNPLVVPAEIGLLGVFLLHVYKTVAMWLRNRGARPVGYQKKTWAGHTSRKSLSSTTMIWTPCRAWVPPPLAESAGAPSIGLARGSRTMNELP